jgi:hypothetical protein
MKTGWPPGLLQDDDRKLSRWLASRPDARYQLRMNMKLEQLFTAEELALIDSGEYRPGRAVLDAKLDLLEAAEREACAKAYEAEADTWEAWPQAGAAKRKGAAAIRARGQDPMPLFDDWPGGFK